jgi:hypothetical protein
LSENETPKRIDTRPFNPHEANMKPRYILYGLLGIFLILAGCGPSAQEIATMTASAWTPTPPPTSTPTATPLIPYDVTVTILNETGEPIAGASILFPESGDGNPIQADDQGKYSWTNVEGDKASLTVAAQGYFEAKQSTTLERGPNDVTVTLSRDPMGILPAEACAPGQNVLYIEDFQDGIPQGWANISLGTSGDMPNGWSIIDENGNKILVSANAPSGGGDTLQEHVFDNFVWHIKYKSVGSDADMFFMWRLSQSDVGQKRYVAVVGGGIRPWMVRFLDNASGPNPMNIGQTSLMLKSDQWYSVDVAYFDGIHQVWLDGNKIMEYKDPQPYPEGAIGFETHLDQGKTTQFFIDDLAICELTAPYEPSE